MVFIQFNTQPQYFTMVIIWVHLYVCINNDTLREDSVIILPYKYV